MRTIQILIEMVQFQQALTLELVACQDSVMSHWERYMPWRPPAPQFSLLWFIGILLNFNKTMN